MKPDIEWVAPASLWPAYADASLASRTNGHGQKPITLPAIRRPHILRFTTDDFMAEFAAMLENQPERLGEWQAQPEVWQSPWRSPAKPEQLPPFVRRLERLRLATASTAAGAGSLVKLPPEPDAKRQASGMKLKLYQPAHMRYYLVTASLVCSVPGLPDRTLDAGAGERVGFVVRRLRPKSNSLPTEFNLDTCNEYAFVEGAGWQQATAGTLVDGEEVNPLFGVSYTERDGRRRRVLAGTVPVARREAYVTAPAQQILPSDGVTPKPMNAAKVLFQQTVSEPWRRMADQVNAIIARFGGDTTQQTVVAAQEQAIWTSWMILADFEAFLAKYVPNVWDMITGTPTQSTPSAAEITLYKALRDTSYTDPAPGSRELSLADALNLIRGCCDALEQATLPDPSQMPASSVPCPDFRFALQDDDVVSLVQLAPGDTGPTLDDLVYDALPDDAPEDTPPLPVAAIVANGIDPREPAWFIIRCVFDQPNCVPFVAPTLSDPTTPFQMAAFFDPDAPARPLKINLPVDISPAGLRKFDKNTAFMVSDALCTQMNRMGQITLGDLVLSVLPFPFHKDLPTPSGGECESNGIEFGLICSLSIPIITICALILLMIIVSLLDFIFRWIPFFIMCFPLPRFKAKEA